MAILKQIILNEAELQMYTNIITDSAMPKPIQLILNKQSLITLVIEILGIPYHIQIGPLYKTPALSSEVEAAIDEVMRKWGYEPKHTERIAELLQDLAARKKFLSMLHGKCKTFPEQMFGAEVDNEVTIKHGRIDILISNANKSIIIENKINGADDDPSQLGKYIHAQIHDEGVLKDNIYVVYIPGTKDKQPEDVSWEYDSTHYKSDFVNRFAIVNKSDLRQWISDIYQDLPDELKEVASLESAYIRDADLTYENSSLGGEVFIKFVEDVVKELVTIV